MATSTIKKQADALYGQAYYPVVFGSTAHNGKYYAALPPIPNNATLNRVNALGYGDLPLSDFTLHNDGIQGQSYILASNNAHLFDESICIKLSF